MSFGRHPGRIALTREFGATHIVSQRGELAVERVGELSGGPAPVRAYSQELLADICEGTIHPGRVLDMVTNIDGVPDGYRAMNERNAIKVLIKF